MNLSFNYYISLFNPWYKLMGLLLLLIMLLGFFWGGGHFFLLLLVSRSPSIERSRQGESFAYVHDILQARTHGLMSYSFRMYI